MAVTKTEIQVMKDEMYKNLLCLTEEDRVRRGNELGQQYKDLGTDEVDGQVVRVVVAKPTIEQVNRDIYGI
ncbi:hypothetical protein A3B56_00600 [Candidatus Roizmanbacteria bacterium RIFCSPLOWO2_01_FULL_45_11]|uniref:Uncharacterized protein n=1 Tax=Candidatus Roizmanbacteria bacterium RIFCSPLOWO2_01_FULL_45_11 TaxID=1802070 RepID=A0A1F7JG98_9BACT|nr:MAG: hypothetical protein A3B56_00600 [Candidatus Roizmanbacteria bacterium RIFCSPLOWO2_01_FULL_45_11]